MRLRQRFEANPHPSIRPPLRSGLLSQEEATLNRTEARLKRDGAFKALTQWLRCAQETADDEEEEEHREMEAGPVSVFNP